MTTAFTSLLGFALPVTGELSGTWGDEVNNSITQLVEDSVAGVGTASVASGNWTLTTTGSGASNQARMAILIPTGSPGVSRNIVAPGSSKAYIVINQSDAAVVLKASASTGVTIAAGYTVLCAWNGSDFVKVSENVAGSNTQIQFNNSGTLGASASLTWDGTYLTAGSIKDSALTSGRVTFAGASGVLTDSANLTWNGTTLAVGGQFSATNLSWNGTTLAITGQLTATNLSWNASTLALTGALTATADSSFNSTGALKISKGTEAQRPGTPATSMIRYNTDSNEFEGYSGVSPSWKSIGGSALSNDTSTSSNLYPVFAAATSGTAQNLYTSNAQYLFKPSTGELSVKAPVASNGIFVNSITVSSSYTVPAGSNAGSFGPVTIADGVTVTIPDDSVWSIV